MPALMFAPTASACETVTQRARERRRESLLPVMRCGTMGSVGIQAQKTSPWAQHGVAKFSRSIIEKSWCKRNQAWRLELGKKRERRAA